jgi:hypothetical protein
VHAHIQIKATNIKRMTVFCFTAAKVLLFEELKELMELKGVKGQ